MATSFFRFYYYVIANNPKKYEIAMDQKQSVVSAMTPILLLLIYPFVSMIYLPDGFEYFAYLFIPIVVGNIFFVLNTSSKGYSIKWEAERKKQEAEREKRRLEEEKLETMRRKERQRQQKILEDDYEELFERYYRDFHQQKRRVSNNVDRNKANAVRLMELNNSPTLEEIKKAYRRLSKVHHPDAGGTHENFIRLNKAYDYLMKIL
jgi:hypothetical protein